MVRAVDDGSGSGGRKTRRRRDEGGGLAGPHPRSPPDAHPGIRSCSRGTALAAPRANGRSPGSRVVAWPAFPGPVGPQWRIFSRARRLQLRGQPRSWSRSGRPHRVPFSFPALRTRKPLTREGSHEARNPVNPPRVPEPRTDVRTRQRFRHRVRRGLRQGDGGKTDAGRLSRGLLTVLTTGGRSFADGIRQQLFRQGPAGSETKLRVRRHRVIPGPCLPESS